MRSIGGAGSQVVPAFTAMGIGTIRAVDFDRVELSNLNRQLFFGSREVGNYKVDVMQRRVAALNPSVTFQKIRVRIDSFAKARRAVKGSDVVLCTADGPVHKLYCAVDEACERAHIPWIFFGVNEHIGVIGPFIIHGRTKSYRQIVAQKRKRHPHYLAIVNYFRAHEAHIRKRFIPPSMVPLFMYGGSVLVSETVKYITGFARPSLLNNIMRYDVSTNTVWREIVK